MTARNTLATVALLLASGTAWATDLPAGFGVETPSRSTFETTLADGQDNDDYVFEGYVGTKVTARVTTGRRSTLEVDIQLIDPDGNVLGEQDGVIIRPGRGRVNLRHTLASTGRWKVRVSSGDASDSDYRISLRFTGPRAPRRKNVEPGQGQFVFSIPAAPGAQISPVVRFRGTAPTLVSLTDPTGDTVAGFLQAFTPGRGRVAARRFQIPAGHELGDYTLTLTDNGATRVSFSVRVKPPAPARRRREVLDGLEPVFLTLSTDVGGAGTVLVAVVQNVEDPNDPEGNAGMMVADLPLNDVTFSLQPGSQSVYSVIGTVPPTILNRPIDTPFDVAVSTTTGQVVVASDAFRRVAPPVVTGIVPDRGTAAGGFDVVISGSGFRTPVATRILIDDNIVPQQITNVTDTEVHFSAPPRSPGLVRFGIQDADSQLSASLSVGSFEYLATPGINRIVPGLVSVLGGEDVFVNGAFFSDTDRVFLETEPGGGVFEEITATQTTFLTDKQHRFVAPAREKGTYEIYLEDTEAVRSSGTRVLSYFTFRDVTVGSGLDDVSGGDLHDGWTTALADYDQDDDLDLFISYRGGATKSSATQTRVFANDGDGDFTDVTSLVMPTPSADDDWRADRIRVADVDMDTYPDIIIVTNSDTVPSDNKQHLRVLVNTAGQDGRTFVNRTSDLILPIRSATGFTGGGVPIADNWRGLDMWVGDLDAGGSGPPEIVITHDEYKEENPVLCTPNYCASPYTGNYTYGFYWGGSRAFKWSETANDGKGQYIFDFSFFPRKQGLEVPIFNPPPGATILFCNSGTPCRHKFTPFLGQRLAVGFIDTDAKLDVAVVSKDNLQGYKPNDEASTITMPLQVALNRFDPDTLTAVTDATLLVLPIGGDFRANTVAIGQPGYPDGSSTGVIAIAKDTSAAGATRAMRMIKYIPEVKDLQGNVTSPASFSDISSGALPNPTSTDSYQASAIEFLDVDTDGDQDMVVLSKDAPGGVDVGFRIFRNIVLNNSVGVMREEFRGLLTPLQGIGENLEGSVLTIGDINGDESPEYLITRSVPLGVGNQTRIISTDR